MKKDELDQRLTDMVVDLFGVDKNEVTKEASFEDDFGADSLDAVELIMKVETEFKIAIPDEEADKIKTYGQMLEATWVRVKDLKD
jgi:acyl carrier protein